MRDGERVYEAWAMDPLTQAEPNKVATLVFRVYRAMEAARRASA